jgi:hypothetical protein
MQMTWTIADNRAMLNHDGRREFLLADTLWAAFSRPSFDEWQAYLRARRRQGFNAVSISILPIAHDQSESLSARSPFELTSNGEVDLTALSAEYFSRAGDMVAMAAEEGITAVLVVLWCNYVPDTWGARLTPQLVLDQQQTDRYVELVASTFARYGPIFAISGDERFDSAVATERYARALRLIHASAPQCLTTLHTTPDAVLPDSLADSDDLSFYVYQSGHDTGWEDRSWQLAEQYLAHRVRRPVVDLEPCYEGHGYGKGAGRHHANNIRRASWTAVLAGAGAGLGYAAHGVWSWHRPGDPFGGEHFSGTPFPAQTALAFPGAWDVGLLRHIVEVEDLYHLRPRQDLLIDDHSGARAGASDDENTVAIYQPSPFALRVNGQFADNAICWDLEQSRREFPRLLREGGCTVIEQADFLGDALYILRR